MTAMQPLYIAGAWVVSAHAEPNVNPSDLSDIVGHYAWADASMVATAVAAAQAAKPAMAALGIQARADALDAIGTEILARRAELGDLLAREEGKPLAEATGEVTRAGHIFKFFAGEALRLDGTRMDSVRPGIEVTTLTEPLGVVGLITPWNFPIAIPAWKIAPALAAGNSIVFKPGEQAPACAWALTEIIHRTGLPAGAFNLVMGGRDIGKALVGHPGLDGVSFTGSAAAGASVLADTAAHQTRVQLEMGGKNPLVVLDDADLAVAWDCAIQGAYFSTGQRCTASSRLIIQRGVLDPFIEGLVSRIEALVVDDARKPGTQIGPVVDATQLAKDRAYLDVGRQEGATLACGGIEVERATRGHYLSPALFVNATADMRIAREEIFGPVACVIPADDYEHALALANDTPYGLSSGICTTSLRAANHFRRHSQSGIVTVNLPTAGIDYHVPFGGHKASSHGPREQGHQALEFYTRGKTTYTAF